MTISLSGGVIVPSNIPSLSNGTGGGHVTFGVSSFSKVSQPLSSLAPGYLPIM